MTTEELEAFEAADEFVGAAEQWEQLKLGSIDQAVENKLLVLKVSRRWPEMEEKIKRLCSVLGIPQLTFFIIPGNDHNGRPPLW